MLTLTRRDALPEFTHYRDTGCDLAPACLTCPFAVCRHDLEELRGRKPHPAKTRSDALAVSVIAARRNGATWEELMARFGRSRRQIFILWGKRSRLA